MVGVSLIELSAPLMDTLIGEGEAAHRHQFLDIAVAKGEAEVESDTRTDYFGGEAMTIMERRGRVHRRIMPPVKLFCTTAT